MWSENPIVEQCKVRFPVIQAPMAGIATPRLIAAVSNAGGLGSLGAAYMTPNEMRDAIREIRDLTELPFAVNLFAPAAASYDQKIIDSAQKFLDRFRKELEIPHSSPDFSSLPAFEDQMAVILEEKPKVFSFTLGLPPLPLLQRLKKENILIMGTATTLDEALLLEKCGVDSVIEQGSESGGHRAAFLDCANDPMLSIAALVPLLAHALKIPVIASGGIMNGEGIAAALSLGAVGVQLGTAFLACPESGASRPYKEALLHSHAKTTLTDVFTGKPARMLYNKFIETFEHEKAPIAPFPYQHLLTKDIRIAAAKIDHVDMLSLYAGQNYPLITNLPASEILPLLVEQTIDTIQKLNKDLSEQHPRKRKIV
jgi:nitronate monooxygenase